MPIPHREQIRGAAICCSQSPSTAFGDPLVTLLRAVLKLVHRNKSTVSDTPGHCRRPVARSAKLTQTPDIAGA
jgi:hypothetical protein